MRVPLLPSLLALGLGLPALAQGPASPTVPAPPTAEAPDESWTRFPGQEVQPPPASEQLPALLPPTPAAKALPPPRPPPPPNHISLFSARTLAPGQLALGVSAGFPFASARASLGLLPWLDAGLAVDSTYGSMTSVHAQGRATLLRGSNWALAAALEGGYAFFVDSAVEEQLGPRHQTGRRNWNLLPGFIASYQGDAPQAIRLFLDARCHLAFDTEPVSPTPLGGVPSGLQVAGNAVVRLGLEIPLSEGTSLVTSFGGGIHGRPEDSSFMPDLGVGLVFGL